MSHIKANQGQEILRNPITEYPLLTNEQIQVFPQILTGQKISGERFGLDTFIHGIYRVSAVSDLVEAPAHRRVIKATGHVAKKNDFIQFYTGANIGQEIQVLSVPDANTIVLASNLEVLPSVGDEFYVLRSVTPRYSQDGDLNVSSGPVRFTLDAVDTLVREDTADATNNHPMPSGMMIKKDDGKYYPVTLDTSNPYAHTPIPVVITDLAGSTTVNITAGDLNVSIKHNGADPSSVRIGDGTETANVNASNELQVADDTARTHLATLAGAVSGTEMQVDVVSSALPTGAATAANQTTEIGHLATLAGAVAGSEMQVDVVSSALPTGAATEATLAALAAEDFATQTTLAAVLTELQLKADLTETQPVSVASLPLPTGAATEATLAALAAEDFATQTTLAALLTELQLKADLTETQPVSAASLPLPTGAATEATLAALAAEDFSTETTLAAMSAKLPATLGQKTMANSMAVVISSDQSAIATTETHQYIREYVIHDASSSNITTGAFVTAIASTGATTKAIKWSDDIGDLIGIATGAAASEVIIAVAALGGDTLPVNIPAGTRISLKALGGSNITSGKATIQLIG